MVTIDIAINIWEDKISDDVDFVLLLPGDDVRFNNRLCAAFSAKLGNRTGVVVEGSDADLLLSLYSLFAFSDKLIIGSLNQPYGRKLVNLISSGVATEEEAINDAILGTMG